MDEKTIKVVLVTKSQTRKGDKLKLTVKARAETIAEGEAIRTKLLSHIYTHEKPDYRVVDADGYAKLLKLLAKDGKRRKEEGVKKAQATREKNIAKGVKRKPAVKVVCPKCRASSKKLFSEMGGLQTRQCKMGHRFTFDKWIMDRAFWSPATALAHVYGKA